MRTRGEEGHLALRGKKNRKTDKIALWGVS
jgi:hypothetical protein